MPEINIKNYSLELAVEGTTKKTLDFNAIKKYKKYTLTAAVMCGGNRRSEMAKVSINCILIKIIIITSLRTLKNQYLQSVFFKGENIKRSQLECWRCWKRNMDGSTIMRRIKRFRN